MLETKDSTDFNGVILLSQILNFDCCTETAATTIRASIMSYELALPTYAATAWYHHKLAEAAASRCSRCSPRSSSFAMGDYAQALREGSALSPDQRDAIAAKLHDYTGLPVAYIKKANLRIDGGEFEQNLQGDTDSTTGRLDYALLRIRRSTR